MISRAILIGGLLLAVPALAAGNKPQVAAPAPAAAPTNASPANTPAAVTPVPPPIPAQKLQPAPPQAAPPAVAARPPDLVPAPATATGRIVIDGKQVPLPAGTWLHAGSGQPSADVDSTALLRVEGGRVTDGILVHTSKPTSGAASWGTAPACLRRDLIHTATRYASDHDGSCAWVSVVEAGGSGEADPAWQAAGTLARARGWEFPTRWAEVAIRVNDPVAALEVRYVTALDVAAPLPAGYAGWAGWAGWTAAAWEQVELGNLSQLPETARLPALGVTAPPSAPSADDGQIPRAVWKTLTFRGIVTTLDFTTNVIFIGDLMTASLLSAWNTVTGPWLYLAHELAWDYFTTPTLPHRELPGIGVEKGAS